MVDCRNGKLGRVLIARYVALDGSRLFSEKLAVRAGKIIEVKGYRIGALYGVISGRRGAFQRLGQFFPVFGNANQAALADFVFSFVGELGVHFCTPSALHRIRSH